MKGYTTIAGWAAAAGLTLAVAAVPARGAAAPVTAKPAATPPATKPPAASPPTANPAVLAVPQPATFQQAEDLLKGRGLTLAGFTWVVPSDAKLPVGLGKMRQAKAKQDAYIAKRKQCERNVAEADAAVTFTGAQMVDAANRVNKANDQARDYNQIVVRFNVVKARFKEAERMQAEANKALAELPQPAGDYVGELVELATDMDEAADRYADLAADPYVAAALAKINVTARPQHKLGPSAQFAQELRGVRFQRDAVTAQAIPCEIGGNNLVSVKVKLNDAEPVDMLVDSGASSISLTAAVARRAGIVPGPNDPVVTSTIANGATVEKRLVKARSVRVGPYLLHDVECTIGPESQNNAPLLLGGSFLKNFVVRLDLGAKQIHLTPVLKTRSVKKDPLAVDSPKPVGLGGGRIEVTVPSARNGDNPIPTGIRLVAGQAVTFAPYTADRWRASPDSNHKWYDYRGNPEDAGSMRMRWKIGSSTGDVTPGKPAVAAEAGELMLFCNDTRTDDNSGSIRVTIVPGPPPVTTTAPPIGPAVPPSPGSSPGAEGGGGKGADSKADAGPADGLTAEALATRVSRLKSAWSKPPAAAGTPAAMPLGDPLKAEVVWSATPAGFALDGRVQVGNFDKNKFGGEYKGHVRAESGFRLEGGTIVVTTGTLDLIGTPDRPIVFRNVKIGCEMFGAIKAKHVVFDDCTFYKAPGGFWNAGYTSKWTFDDCLVRNSSFEGLGRIDYGFKFRRTTFFDCAFPARRLVEFKDDKAEVDAAAMVKHEWNEVADCEFFRCRISTSVTWALRRCNLIGCTITDVAKLATKTDLAVELGLGPADVETLEDLRSKTSVTGSGKLTYTAAAAPYPSTAFPRD